jgi:hypothetical protein
MNEYWVQGFMRKCAEAGVDPDALIKEAVRGDQLARLLEATAVGGYSTERALASTILKHLKSVLSLGVDDVGRSFPMSQAATRGAAAKVLKPGDTASRLGLVRGKDVFPQVNDAAESIRNLYLQRRPIFGEQNSVNTISKLAPQARDESFALGKRLGI